MTRLCADLSADWLLAEVEYFVGALPIDVISVETSRSLMPRQNVDRILGLCTNISIHQ